jgi:uncharacterized membrane protein YphA (DoxX/SURF4 family)
LGHHGAAVTQDSKERKIGYWITTALVGVAFAIAGVADLLSPPDVVAQFNALGYPAYLPRLLGVAKLLGAVAILAPRFPRLKEWAYAGICFDLIGALYSYVANGDDVGELVPPAVLLLLTFASYFLRPGERRLS